MKRNVSVVLLIVAKWNSGPPASGNIIKEMPGSVASGTPYILEYKFEAANYTLRFSRRCPEHRNCHDMSRQMRDFCAIQLAQSV